MAATLTHGTVGKYRGRWRGRITKVDEGGTRHNLTKMLKDADGNPIPCEAKGNKGRSAAIAALTRWRDELSAAEAEDEAAEARSASLSGVTLGDYLDAYLDGLKASHSVEKSTMTAYRASARKVAESLGSVEVTELSREQVQAWEARLMNVDGLSPRSVTKHHRLLSQALKSAVEAGRLAANPCEGVRLPKRHREQPHAMTRDAANRLLGTLAAMPQKRAVAAARIALTSGLRVGEVCALTWADADADAGVLHVNKAVGMGGGGAYVKPPKNPYSVRDVPLTPQLRAALDARRSEVMAEAEALDVLPTPEQLASCYVIGGLDGRYPTPSVVSREWGQLRDLLGVTDADGHPLKFHDLRHTWATIAVQSGADIKSVSAIMGHADASMTLNTYASSDADARRVAAEKISRFMGEAPRHGGVEAFRPTGTEGRQS
ncbi:MAG: tyrosine-type recombinase/integrase [Olsenella sp.]|nr:tyrosine-type recombinase/integrase [Olsenella sp.]